MQDGHERHSDATGLMYAELIGPVIASRRKAGAKCSILVKYKYKYKIYL
jgi:hypothetical protein